MFDDWMGVWRETVDSFDRELHGSETDSAARGMRRQLTDARAAIARVNTEIERALAIVASEREAEQVCLRRQTMAEGIDDEETARIAAEYAARHAERADLYARKTAVLREELALMTRDLDVMEAEFGARIETETADDEEDADEPTGKPRRSRKIENAAAEKAAQEAAERQQHDAELARLRRERAATEKLEELKRRMRG